MLNEINTLSNTFHLYNDVENNDNSTSKSNSKSTSVFVVNLDDDFNNNNSCIGTIYNRLDTYESTIVVEKGTSSNGSEYSEHTNPNANINIFRFKFTDEFMKELNIFSKIHQYDHRKDFKAAWETWIEAYDGLIKEESERLTCMGYEGDILDKMFKSERYYFRKKTTEKKTPKVRKIYVGVQKDLLEAMDEQITNGLNDREYKPSEGFLEFCKANTELLKEEIQRLNNGGIYDNEEIKNKIKKTYKNRYFMIINK